MLIPLLLDEYPAFSVVNVPVAPPIVLVLMLFIFDSDPAVSVVNTPSLPPIVLVLKL